MKDAVLHFTANTDNSSRSLDDLTDETEMFSLRNLFEILIPIPALRRISRFSSLPGMGLYTVSYTDQFREVQVRLVSSLIDMTLIRH